MSAPREKHGMILGWLNAIVVMLVPLYLLKGLALCCYQPSLEVLISINTHTLNAHTLTNVFGAAF